MDIDTTAGRIHQTAADHGFWDKPRNLGEMLMLVTSELAEALEEDRAGNPLVYFKCGLCGAQADQPDSERHLMPSSNKVLMIIRKIFHIGPLVPCDGVIDKPEGALVEVCDAIIRLFDTGWDMAERTPYTVGQVMAIKMAYNNSREHMHGKAY